jgi:hypothetical protein
MIRSVKRDVQQDVLEPGREFLSSRVPVSDVLLKLVIRQSANERTKTRRILSRDRLTLIEGHVGPDTQLRLDALNSP